MHAFLEPHKDVLNRNIEEEKTLDLETLCEGIAYALSPGIYHSNIPNSDPLHEQVMKDIKNGRSLHDPYVRFRRFGLALRPLLIEALQDEAQTIQTFLPRAIQIWLIHINHKL